MRTRKYLLLVCLSLLSAFTNSPVLVKYYLIAKGDKGYGYDQSQSVLQLNYDSTFVKTVTFQNNRKKVTEIVKIETFDGKWYLKEDTLILEYNPVDSILLNKSKFLIGKRKFIMYQCMIQKGKI